MCLLSNITSWPPLGQITFMQQKRGTQDNTHATNVRTTEQFFLLHLSSVILGMMTFSN